MDTEIESDELLLARVREEGDSDAFACLYQRHAPAARRYARSLCGSDTDADDIAAEVLTGLLASLRRGRGPTQLALPYLLASIRNRHWRTVRRRAHEAALVRTVGVSTAGCETTAIVEADVLRTALSTLPVDVQALLWRTEVDDECLADASDGTSAHNVAVHRHRARRALGTAYLAQHAEPDGGLIGLDADCKTTVLHLASLVRNKIGVRRRRRLERHLAGCEHCAEVRQRLELVNTRLRVHPKLPWTIWSAGLTSTIKAEVSGWLGTSAVTLAGSSALAMSVLVPTPMLLEDTGSSESQSAAVADSLAREDRESVREISAEDRVRSDQPAHVDDAGESSPFEVPPTTDPATPSMPPTPTAAGEDRGSIVIATTSVDAPPSAIPRDGAAPGGTTAPLLAAAPGEGRSSVAPSAKEADEAEASVEQADDDDPSNTGKGQSTSADDVGDSNSGHGQSTSTDDDGASGGQGNGGTGQPNADDGGQAPSSDHRKGNANGHDDDDGQTHGGGQGKGNANGHDDDDGQSHGGGQGNGNTTGRALAAPKELRMVTEEALASPPATEAPMA